MFRAAFERLKQKHRTNRYPAEPGVLPEHFRGYPVLLPERCPPGCGICTKICPTNAIFNNNWLAVDMGKCLFCPECTRACPTGAVSFSRDEQIAATERNDLVVKSGEERRKALA